MNRTIAAMAVGGLLAMAAAAPALALPATMAAEGRCDVAISTGAIGAGDHCARMSVRQVEATGEFVVRFEFERGWPADGMAIELEGSGMHLGDWMVMSPGRMRWTNAGGRPQEFANPAGDSEPQVTGQCAVLLMERATRIDQTHCRLRTPLGDLTVVFKVEKAKE